MDRLASRGWELLASLAFFLWAPWVFSAGIASAQEGSATTVRLMAVTQFTKGQVKVRSTLLITTPLVHRAPIYEKEQIEVPADGRVKFITNQDCIAVVFGPGKAMAPCRS